MLIACFALFLAMVAGCLITGLSVAWALAQHQYVATIPLPHYAT